MEAQQTPLRTAIMRIMSDMLDSADEHGIYETGRFMDRIEQLLCDMMVAPEVLQLSGSEAVMGFLAWLTTRDETTVLSPSQEVDISLYERFVETNQLTEPREAWHELLIHPKPLEPELATETEVQCDPKRDPKPAPLEFGGLILTTLANILVEEEKEAEFDYIEVIKSDKDGNRVIASGTLDEVLFALTKQHGA